ncbi:hypothetical protein V6N11_011477 [Hibiscus sabdariffa]|uniref:Uncharacterized protein n=1 Tax=Hibiscus sabdariffa TaxID=183260 RepID=A0ABR2S8C0_9ROSI
MMENKNSGGVNVYEDADTLELEEDDSINATIKEHALVGKYGPWLRATSTWIKHNNSKNFNPPPIKNKPLLVDNKPSEEEEAEKEHYPNETVPDRSNSTRVEDATALVTGKVLQIDPMVNAKVVVISSDILGEAMDPGLSGIVAAHNEKGCGTKQLVNDTLVMSGGFFNWNRSITMLDQHRDKSIRGKSKISEEGFNDEPDKTMEDIMADSFKDMDCLLTEKGKLKLLPSLQEKDKG